GYPKFGARFDSAEQTLQILAGIFPAGSVSRSFGIDEKCSGSKKHRDTPGSRVLRGVGYGWNRTGIIEIYPRQSTRIGLHRATVHRVLHLDRRLVGYEIIPGLNADFRRGTIKGDGEFPLGPEPPQSIQFLNDDFIGSI